MGGVGGVGHGVLEDAAALLLGGLSRACLGGALFALGVWLLCRLTSRRSWRLPAAARFYLWWLACAKMLVALFCASSLLLPVALPSRDAAPPVAAAFLARFSVRPVPPAEKSRSAIAISPSVSTAHAASEPRPTSDSAAASATTSHRAALRLPSAAVLLMAAYLVGVTVFAGAGIRSILALRRILRCQAVCIAPGDEGGPLADAARRRAACHRVLAPGYRRAGGDGAYAFPLRDAHGPRP